MGDESEDDSKMTGTGPALLTPPRKKSKVWYQQAFCEEWMADGELKDWIKPDSGNRYAAICTVCSCTLTNVNKTALLAHKVTQKHMKNFEAKSKTLNIKKFFNKPKEPSLHDKVAKAEIVLTAFMAEHNTPFLQADHLIECCKQMFPDSAIAQKMSLKRTKAAYVMQYGIAHFERLEVINICINQKFSIIVDESTDVSTNQMLAVVVRFCDTKTRKVVDSLLDLIVVEDGTGLGLFTAVKKLLDRHAIPITNVIGFAADNCATMMGSAIGFQAQLKKEIPHVFVLGCVCHSFALCANAASNRLPSWLEVFVKNVCFYFSRSSKRNHEFQLIQDVVQVQQHKVLKLCETRWLSREAVIERILEQWDALQLYFQSQASVDKVDGAGQILQTMNTPRTKHMLLFVGYILGKVNEMNIEFQSQNFRLHKLYKSVIAEYRFLLSLFIREEVLQSCSLAEIDPSEVTVHKKLGGIELGGRCEAQLIRQSLGDKEVQFRKDVLSFLIELCIQIRRRFPLEQDSVLAQMQLLDPKQALESNKPSIITLAVKFPTVVSDENLDRLSDQWKELASYKNDLGHLVNNYIEDPPAFWLGLQEITDANNKKKFDVLCNFMCTLLALPHSSACVERVFSKVNLVKTKQTNKLLCETVANRILAKQAVAKDRACHQFKPNQIVIEDVREGRCRQRYADILKLHNQLSKLSIPAYDLDEAEVAVVDMDAHSLLSDSFQQ